MSPPRQVVKTDAAASEASPPSLAAFLPQGPSVKEAAQVYERRLSQSPASSRGKDGDSTCGSSPREVRAESRIFDRARNSMVKDSLKAAAQRRFLQEHGGGRATRLQQGMA